MKIVIELIEEICCIVRCMEIIIKIIFLLIFAPFIFFDLYYTYHDTTCINIPAQLITPIYFTLGIWFQVMAYSLTALVLIFLLALNFCLYLKMCQYVFYILLVENSIWIIIGSVFFWGELYIKKPCSKNILDYLFCHLIFGITGICYLLYLIIKTQVYHSKCLFNHDIDKDKDNNHQLNEQQEYFSCIDMESPAYKQQEQVRQNEQILKNKAKK